ncbi:RTA1-domain-containing protein [Wolfiporia cocos MD-104 SS10]|uniref:RTA1-domain-containing protein n=1 Tax=Wolfiporia cocos (strain MD-104) TaxID=742152 RepID=A0A2H3JDR3_WOLCO|nr:RTA1-domain-containing protein [Wolfiporia cocos MD-104 SS10]
MEFEYENLAARGNKYFNRTPYGYTPDKWVGILFIVLFSLTALCHAIQAVRYRLWWLLGTACVAGALEIIGWGGRLWSAYNVLLNTPYLMQIVCTIIAPTPLVAANFIILGRVIQKLGSQYSRLSAKWYTAVFVSCDIVALVVQAVGGGAASAAVNQDKNPNNGGHIMLAGIVFQMAAITVYMLLAGEFILRYLYNKPIRGSAAAAPGVLTPRMKQMLFALTFSSLCIYVRSWYRTIELADGWFGRIIETQRYFVIMDAMMIVFAMVALNLFHPGRLLFREDDWDSDVQMQEAFNKKQTV